MEEADLHTFCDTGFPQVLQFVISIPWLSLPCSVKCRNSHILKIIHFLQDLLLTVVAGELFLSTHVYTWFLCIEEKFYFLRYYFKRC